MVTKTMIGCITTLSFYILGLYSDNLMIKSMLDLKSLLDAYRICVVHLDPC